MATPDFTSHIALTPCKRRIFLIACKYTILFQIKQIFFTRAPGNRTFVTFGDIIFNEI